MDLKYKKFATALMMAVSIGLLVAGVSVLSGSIVRAVGPETGVVTGKVDSATLVRTGNGLSMTLKASGFNQGHAVTVWWEVPEDGVVCNAAGSIVGASGSFNTGSHLAKGGEPSETGFCIGELTNTDAPVRLVVLDHGPKETGQDLVDELNTPFAGCDGPCTFVGDATFN